MLSKLRPYTPYFILASIFLLIVAPTLYSDGMFMDGTIYAAVSKNMAQGLGTFWHPHLSQGLYPEFYEHPPLALGLQALCFKFFGVSFLVERFYSLSTYFISAFLLLQIWILFGKEKKTAWIPLVFWIANPLVIWAAANNMLENTLQVFILAALVLLLKSLKSKPLLWIFLSGLFLFLGVLTKGPVALFPLSFFFWHWVFSKNKNFQRMLLNSALLLLFTVLPLILLLSFNTQAYYALHAYYLKQIVLSLTQIQTMPSRFFIVFRLINEILINLGLIGIVLFVFRKKYTLLISNFIKYKPSIFLFLALGLSGVLPIMLSLKQSGFYIVPTFPFFALAFGIFVSPFFEKSNSIGAKKSFLNKYEGLFSFILFILVFVSTLSFKNKVGRDKAMLHDVYAVISKVSNNELVEIPKNLAQNWPLHAYFARYSTVSLVDVVSKPHQFYLTKAKTFPPQKENYEKVNLDLIDFSLFQLINP